MRPGRMLVAVWAGNVLLFVAALRIGGDFWQAKKAESLLPPVIWPTAAAPHAGLPRWPGHIMKFEHIWKTPLDGVAVEERPRFTGCPGRK